VIYAAAFDSILEYQFENYNEDWVIEGRSRGYTFKPKRSSTMIKWINFNPNNNLPYWAVNDKQASILITRLKWINRIWYVYIILIFPIVIVFRW
jgi:hypothetical protein